MWNLLLSSILVCFINKRKIKGLKKDESAGTKRNKNKWNVQRMFLFMLISSLRLPSLVTPRHMAT